MDTKNIKELMDMLRLKETVDELAKANVVRCFGHVLRREKDDVLRKALVFKVSDLRRRGLPRKEEAPNREK